MSPQLTHTPHTHTHSDTQKGVRGAHEWDTRGDCGVTSKWNQNKIKPLKKRDGRKKRERAAIEEVVVVVVFLLSS